MKEGWFAGRDAASRELVGEEREGVVLGAREWWRERVGVSLSGGRSVDVLIPLAVVPVPASVVSAEDIAVSSSFILKSSIPVSGPEASSSPSSPPCLLCQ